MGGKHGTVCIIPVPVVLREELVLLCSQSVRLLPGFPPASILSTYSEFLSPLPCCVAYCCHSLHFRGGSIVPKIGQFRTCLQERGATDAYSSCRDVTGLWPTVPDAMKKGTKPTAGRCKMICLCVPSTSSPCVHTDHLESVMPARLCGVTAAVFNHSGSSIPSRSCPHCWEHSRRAGPSSFIMQPWKSLFQHGCRRAGRAGCLHLLWSLL